jgi:hypothetical protein
MLKFKKNFNFFICFVGWHWGHCATIWNVAGSITDGHLILGVYSASKINIRSVSLGVRRPVRKTDNLTTFVSRLS